MRTRKEIEASIERDPVGRPDIDFSVSAIVELLLDIRDLLTKD